MSSIEGLSIRGVRSFGPDDAQVIKFAKPLTVIVGENGCGKTTIIECLKYATTGSLPPGVGAGASFVHDPKIAGTSEVKGQIKLKFKNKWMQTTTVTRDLQVTQSRSKVTFKAIDAVLKVMDYSEGMDKKKVATTSHACSKMDVMMSELFGVPKAVLEHVVFCHQEDSNWPLQEGAKLKERFDQLFESSRYTKALDDIRKIRKEKDAERKEADAKLATAEAHTQSLKRMRSSVNALREQEGGVQDQMQGVETSISQARDMVNRIRADIAKVEEYRKGMQVAKVRLNETNNMMVSVQAEIKGLGPAERDAYAHLQSFTRDQFEAHAAGVDDQLKGLQADLTAANQKVASLRQQEQQLSRDILSLTSAAADKVAAQRQKQQLEAEFVHASSQAASRFSISHDANGFVYTPSNASTFIDKLKNHSQGIAVALNEYKDQQSFDLDSKRRAATDAEQQVAMTTAQESVKTQELRKAVGDVKAATGRYNDLARKRRLGETRDAILGKRQIVQQRLNEASAKFNPESIKRDQEEKSDKIRSAEDALATLRRIHSEQQSQAATHAQVRMLDTERREKLGQTLQLMGSSKAARTALLKPTAMHLQPSEVEEAVKRRLNALDDPDSAHNRRKRVAEDLDKASRDHANAQSSLRSEEDRVRKNIVRMRELYGTLQQQIESTSREVKEVGLDKKENGDPTALWLFLNRLAAPPAVDSDTQSQIEDRNNSGVILKQLTAATDQQLQSAPATTLLHKYVPLSDCGMDTAAVQSLADASKLTYTIAQKADSRADGFDDIIEEAKDYQCKDARSTGACWMCNRKFDSQAQRKAYVDRLEMLVQNYQQQLNSDETERKAKLAETVMGWVSNIRPLCTEYDAVWEALMVCKRDGTIDSLQKAASEAQTALNAAMAEQENARKFEQELQALLGVGQKLSSLVRDSNQLASKLSELGVTNPDKAIVSGAGAGAGAGSAADDDGASGDAKPIDVAVMQTLLDLAIHLSEYVRKQLSRGQRAVSVTMRPSDVASCISTLDEKLSSMRSALHEQSRQLQDSTSKTMRDRDQLHECDKQLQQLDIDEQQLQDAKKTLERADQTQADVQSSLNDIRENVRKARETAEKASRSRAEAEERYSRYVRDEEERTSAVGRVGEQLSDLQKRIDKARAVSGAANDASSSSGSNADRQLASKKSQQEDIQCQIAAMAGDIEKQQREERRITASKSILGLHRRLYALSEQRNKHKADFEDANAKMLTQLQSSHWVETFGSSDGDGGYDDDGANGGDDGAVDLTRDDDDDGDDAVVAVGQRRPRPGSASGAGAGRGPVQRRRVGQGQLDVDLFQRDPAAALEQLARDYEEQVSGYQQAKARLDGRLGEISSSIKKTQDEMVKTPELRNCEKVYRDAVIESTVLENVVADLDTYYKALDSALMQYHHAKLNEINSIIKELWINTYSGGDIDSIEIRSDLEDAQTALTAASGAGAGAAAAASTSSKGSKSYNYRVVMMKGDAELDMRGRCSAGQKALASIVIRLALAESFCVSTGILALDEPTTNLDTDNKQGLAKALAGIIAARAGQNLQLVVITHDEEFVSELGRATNDGGGSSSRNQVGTYYRVFRQEVRPGVFNSRIELLDDYMGGEGDGGEVEG